MKKLIPFSWLPASWGLAGPARAEAEAYYYLSGYDLDDRLAEIRYTGTDLLREKAAIKHRYGMLTDHEFAVEIASLIEDETDRKVALLDVDAQYGVRDPFETEKEIATIRGEPWVRVINDGLSPDDDGTIGPNSWFFEFDWNDIWIEQLRDAGYMGSTDEAVVQSWFQNLCRAIMNY